MSLIIFSEIFNLSLRIVYFLVVHTSSEESTFGCFLENSELFLFTLILDKYFTSIQKVAELMTVDIFD